MPAFHNLRVWLVIRLGVTSPPWSPEAAGSGEPEGERPAREGLTRGSRS